MDHWLILFVCFPLAGYLIGSTPFGVILARAHGVNLREVGSGNVGATNVARALGRKWGYLCFVLDVLKGFVPVMAAGVYLRTLRGFPSPPHQAAWLGVGFGVIAGHVFSFYLRFRGGKGVASSLGVVLGMYPYFTFVGLIALVLWIVVTLVSRYVSLGSVTAAAAFVPLFVAIGWLMGWRPIERLWPLLIFAAAMVVLIVWRHRTNIVRLARGTENRIGSRKE